MVEKNPEYFDVPDYEECSKTFTTKDANDKICPECWKKLVNLSGEGQG